jgi:hypothetical protein
VISPDGRWVAYVVAPMSRPGERRLGALWLAVADSSSPWLLAWLDEEELTVDLDGAG